MSEHLDRLARRVAEDPFFLAPALACYARGEGLGDAGLAARLGCELPVLTLLRLCRMPRPDGGEFMTDIQTIAGRFGLDPITLARAVRRGQNLLRLRPPAGGAAEGGPGFLVAARDAEPEPIENPEEGRP